jgi:DNA repair protein RecO (recombination protein O)
MHHWTDEALILDVAKFGDNDAIVTLFSPQHGLCKGVVKGGMSSKKRADLQPATQVQATWKARLEQHMGTVTVEGAHGFGSRVMHDPLRLSAVGSVSTLLASCLAERDPHPELYYAAVNFLKHIAAGVEPIIWLTEYVRLELAILELAGFGLDLSECAATGQVEELVYVSPKSGRAVSRAAGEPYHERMLALPAFLITGEELPDSMAEIAQGVTLTGHFIETRLLPALHRHTPPLRTHFCGLLLRQSPAA